MTSQNIITPIDSDEISPKKQLGDRLQSIKDYIQSKGAMTREQSREVWNALDLLTDEVDYWF